MAAVQVRHAWAMRCVPASSRREPRWLTVSVAELVRGLLLSERVRLPHMPRDWLRGSGLPSGGAGEGRGERGEGAARVRGDWATPADAASARVSESLRMG